jgi:hypothetical protein
MFFFMPKNIVFVAIIVIEIAFSAASSSLFFTNFDGPYLVAWSIVINFLLAQDKHPVVRQRFGRRLGVGPS